MQKSINETETSHAEQEKSISPPAQSIPDLVAALIEKLRPHVERYQLREMKDRYRLGRKFQKMTSKFHDEMQSRGESRPAFSLFEHLCKAFDLDYRDLREWVEAAQNFTRDQFYEILSEGSNWQDVRDELAVMSIDL